MTYKEYLFSEKWSVIKAAVLKKYGTCTVCGESEQLEVHHKTYKNIFNEKLEDLTLLCKYHHMVAHGLVKTKSKKKTVPFYRKRVFEKYGIRVKNRGYVGLAKKVAEFNGSAFRGKKKQAKKYLAIMLNR